MLDYLVSGMINYNRINGFVHKNWTYYLNRKNV